MSKVPLVIFSGMDGAGKSTQIELLVTRWRDIGKSPIQLWARGGYTPGMEWLKRTARRCLGRTVVPAAGPSAARTAALARRRTRKWWLRLAILDLIWLYAVKIRWWRLRGFPVVCDRYWYDTELDFMINFPQEPFQRSLLWRLLCSTAATPTHRFLLLISPAASLERSALKREPFPDSLETLQQRLAAYQSWPTQRPWYQLDGLRPRNDLAQEIAQRVGLPSDLVHC